MDKKASPKADNPPQTPIEAPFTTFIQLDGRSTVPSQFRVPGTSRKQPGLQREVWPHGRGDERRNFFMRTRMAVSGFPRLPANADFPSATLPAHSKSLSASPLTNG